jgi:putative toxin-antitoxin system antitoxin component (TIGR02293 family)
MKNKKTQAGNTSTSPLQTDEPYRTVILARIIGKTTDLFEGDERAALGWLSQPQQALGGQVPLEHSRTEQGAAEVENLIGRLEQGVFP